MPAQEGVRKQIEAFRHKLLDLTLNNRMLNYKPSKRLSIEMVGEGSSEVHRILVEQGKKMSFVGRPDPPKRKVRDEVYDASDDVIMAELRQAAEEELDAYLMNPVLPADTLDTKLNTAEYESILQVKLRAILRESNIARDELGINTLFLTLGMLEWREKPERSFKAPLVYVPVKLEKQANGTVKISYEGSDLGENLPLRHKLQEFNLQLPEWDDEKPLYQYFNEVMSTIRGRQDWDLERNEVSLGFFNYEKYAMYMDLGGDLWPEGRRPWEDPDICAMLDSGGFAYIEDSIGEGKVDPFREPADCHEVYDSDSSQTIALIRAAQGLSMVIEGPPGTGKSQTITNIIAEAVAAGKTVLFVSAKRAAVEVVKRRLSDAGLDDMCLDLHDKLTNRRQFYSEIKRTVNKSLTLRDETERVARLTEIRDKLNAHSAAVNEPLPEFGITPFEAMIQLSRLPQETAEDREGRLPFEQIRTWNSVDLERFEPAIRAMQARLGDVGVPADHPFWGCGISYLDPAKRLDVQEDLLAAQASLEKAVESIAQAAGAFGIPAPASASDTKALRLCLERKSGAPPLEGISVTNKSWKENESTVRETIANLVSIRAKKVAIASYRRSASSASPVQPAAWKIDLSIPLAAYERHASKWYRILFSDFRDAKRQVLTLMTGSGPTAARVQLMLLRDLQSVSESEQAVLSREKVLKALFGSQWQGPDSDPEDLQAVLEWMLSLQADVDAGRLSAAIFEFFAGDGHSEDVGPLVTTAEEDAGRALESFGALARTLEFPSGPNPEGFDPRSESLKGLLERVVAWQDNLPSLGAYINYGEARRAALADGLGLVVGVADRWALAKERLLDATLRSYYLGVVRQAMECRPALRTFERGVQEGLIREFKDLDDFKLKYNRARVRIAHHRNMPTFEQALGNLKLLKIQCELQRAHKPIRWIMARAGEAIQQIKPVFMMSPLSVAIHLPPELPPFDLVIFDEASQVKPEDALCAVARAKQTIVVGDTRQMPPTSFFDRVGEGEEADETDEEMETAHEAAKLESILSLMAAVVQGRSRRPDLRWHYRSIHPALIEPSNEMFYDGRLIVFPTAHVRLDGSEVGVVFHHHPETVYEAGAARRVNRKEAEMVADAVLRHVQTEPHLSLMVAAMNKPQADLIDQEVEKRKALHPEAFAAYKPKIESETIKVRNLENVQGDERDVIFISVTYGRDSSGVIRQNFGPLLKSGGERRLNVLISRARRRCEVFSNMTSGDIRAEAGQAGLTCLKRYLRFAEEGRLEVSLPTGETEESPFEEEVSAALRAHGYKVDTQVGCAGFRIDLAIVDPSSPGSYLLGVECDGATYHSAKSARDRDKLREQVLIDRGWRLHRIWSHDWWQDKDDEVKRLLRAIREDRRSPLLPPTRGTSEEFVEEAEGGRRSRSEAYNMTPIPDFPLQDFELPSFVASVVDVEGPICHELLLVRIKAATGSARAGAAIRRKFDGAIARATITQIGDAYISNPKQRLRLRDWSSHEDKRFDYVTHLELNNALNQVIQESFGVDREGAVHGASALLGFKGLGKESKDKLREIVEMMISTGFLRVENEMLYPAG